MSHGIVDGRVTELPRWRTTAGPTCDPVPSRVLPVAMEIVVVLIVLTIALVVWRAVSRWRGSSRPVDSGHPHLTDVDPHDPGS